MVSILHCSGCGTEVQYSLRTDEEGVMMIVIYEDKDIRKFKNEFIDLVDRYAISYEELLNISEDVCRYVTCTRKTDLRDLLFMEGNYNRPRIIRKF